jgi:hypothetical protein
MRFYSRPLSAVGFALLSSLLVAACAESNDSPPVSTSPACEAAYPESAGESAVYVAPSCASDSADGTRDLPYATIQAAIDSAPGGSTILIEPGTYSENLSIKTDGITLVGASDGQTAAQAAVTVEAPNGDLAAIMVDGATDTKIQGLNLLNPGVAGIWLQRGSLVVDSSTIEAAVGDADGAFGFGLLAQEPAGIWLQRTAITGCASTGVMIHGGTGALTLEGNTIDGNKRGGVRVENHQDGGMINDNSLNGNHETGIALLSVVGIWLQNNGVHDTKSGGPSMSADGVLIAGLHDGDGVSYGASEVVVGGDESGGDALLGNQISGNGRVGILLSGDVSSVIMDNESDTNGRAGIWLQNNAGMKAGIWLQKQAETGIWLQSQHAEAGIWLQNNGAMGNSFVGISVGAGTRAAVMSNVISDTEAGQMIEPDGIGTITMGDGIGVFANASARVEGNSLSGNARLGVLGDGLSADSVISGNEFTENGAGDVALQGMSGVDMPSGTDVEGVNADSAGGFAVVPESNDPNGFASGGLGMVPPS